MPFMCNSSGVWKDISTPTGGGNTEVETGYLTKTYRNTTSTARWWKIGNLVIVNATASGYDAPDIQLPWSSTPASVSDRRAVEVSTSSSTEILFRTCNITTKCKITFSDSAYVHPNVPMTFWLATTVTE